MTTDQIVVAVHGESTQRAINIADRPVAAGLASPRVQLGSWTVSRVSRRSTCPADRLRVNGDLDDGEVCLYTVSNPNPTAAPLRVGAGL